MKNRLHQLLMLFVMSIVSLSSWADRVRPTIPTTTLESGKTYYLYNVEADLFMACSSNSSSVMGVNETPRATELTQLENGAWVMRYDDNSSTKYYHYRSNEYICCNGTYVTSSGHHSWWTINSTTTDKTYTIQTSSLDTYFYNADQYVGWVGNNSDYVYADRPADGNIHWQLVPADETGDRFVAELKLYKALCMNDGYYDNLVSPYEELYTNRATATPEALTNAAYELRHGLNMSNGYIAPYWNEYPILWSTSDGIFGKSDRYTWALPNSTKDIYGNTINYSSGTYFYRYLYDYSNYDKTSSLSATVNVSELSTFVYSTDGPTSSNCNINVYVDDKLVRTLTGIQMNASDRNRFSEVLQPGKHTIKWVASVTSENSGSFYIRNAGVMKSPLITVSLLRPGSLGTEVLYNTDHIKNVRRLKVKSEMNDDDWAKIKMMSGLLDLDLSEAVITEVPKEQFEVTNSDTTMQFLHRLILPEGVTKINEKAFYYSNIDTLQLPSTMVSIGSYAFYDSHIQEINMPESCIDISGTKTNDENVFRSMYWLKKVTCPKNWKIIPARTFYDCYYLEDINFPENLEIVGDRAFYDCNRAKFGTLPESLTDIEDYAFRGCDQIVNLVIPERVTNLGDYAFEYCHGLKTAVLNVHQYSLANSLFYDCYNLETLRLNSPTVAEINESYYPVQAKYLSNIDLIVPSYLVNNYKLDKYWYNFKSITGFNTSEIQDWTINNPLELLRDRFDGTPNITINANYSRMPSLSFYGTTAQTINNLTIGGSYNTSSVSGKESSVIRYNNYPGQIYTLCDKVTITGDAQVNLWAPSKTWEFFSLPFDCKIADITFGTENTQYAIRYYDGANRATVGATGSWKNYDKTTDVIPAGTGFIIQTNKDTWCYFKAVDNDMKQNMVSYKEFSKTLAVNDCETASNKGWNLIGNPYQCFYNDHSLNFTAPITVWNNYSKNYVAYSLTDDDYAIRPNEAFFVQCPNAEYSTISFPLQGRQLNDVIESQNAAKAAAPAAMASTSSPTGRKLVNLTLSNDEKSDQTRIVLNEKASLDYEMTCDASKFMSMDNSVPQLYTLGTDGTQYAINERPESDGKVQLGFYAATAGSYTIALGRCDAENVYLLDNETGETTEITNGGYTFNAEAGANTGRFVVVFKSGEITGIHNVDANVDANNGAYYNLAGQRVDNANKGIFIINGKKVIK